MAEEQYTVEKILNHISLRKAYHLTWKNEPLAVGCNIDYNFENELRVEEHSDYLYLAKWADFPNEEDNSWEPERNFNFGRDQLIREYKEKNNLPATHSTFKVNNRDIIFKYPLTINKWKSIPVPRLGTTTPRPKTVEIGKTSLDKKRSLSRDVTPALKNKRSSRDATPAVKNVKKRQIIISDDEEEIAAPPVKKRLLSEASVEYGATSPGNILTDNGVDRSSAVDTSDITAKVAEQTDVVKSKEKLSTDRQKGSSLAPITDETNEEVNKKRKEQKKLKNLKNLIIAGDVSLKNHNKNTEVEKSQENATPQLIPNENMKDEQVITVNSNGQQNMVPDECPSMEDLFGENDEFSIEQSAVHSSMEDPQSSRVNSECSFATTIDGVAEKNLNVIRYANQPRSFSRETVLRNVLSSRRCASTEDLLRNCRNQYQSLRKQSKVTSFFAGILKKMQLCASNKLDSKECVTVDMKIGHDSVGSYIWKTKTKHMKKMLGANSLPNKIPAVLYDEPELLAVEKSEIDVDGKSEAYITAPYSVYDANLLPIKKLTLSGITPTVLQAVYKFIKSMSSYAKLSQLFKLVIAFINANSPQLEEMLLEIADEERAILLKGLIDNFVTDMHKHDKISNFQPYQYLISGETANSTFTVGSEAPELCGSGKYPHWKCNLLKVILRVCPKFCFGDDEHDIFPSSSLLHCLQYGSICLQCLLAPVAPLGIDYADIGRFKVDSNILPLIQNYKEKDFLPLLLQNGFDPNGVITDASKQEIVNISDVLQELMITNDSYEILNEHSRVLLNYSTNRLQSALVNHGNLIIEDALTLPHIVRSLGGKEGWIAKYAEICEDSEATTKRILTLNRRIIDEDDLSSENILFILSLNPIKMDVSTSADCDLWLGEPTVPLTVTPAGSARCRVKEVMIHIPTNTRGRIRFHCLKQLSSGCDQYFIMDFKDKKLLKSGKVDIQVCLEKQDTSGIVAENDEELQSFIVQLFVVSRRA